MRILVCTKNDIFGALILNELLKKQHERNSIKVYLSDKTRPSEKSVLELAQVKLLEYEIPVENLFQLVDQQPQVGELLTFRGLADRYGVIIEKIYDINNKAAEDAIRQWYPDIIISARFSLIFKENIFSIPSHGTFNVHPGKLPGYAGLMAPLQALLHDETQLGCTVHKIDKDIDTGPIYAVSYISGDYGESVFNHTVRLYDTGLISLSSLLLELDRGQIPKLIDQKQDEFRYFRLPSAEEFAEARQKGISMWNLPSYINLLMRFVPAGGLFKLPDFFDAAKLQLTLNRKGTN